MTCTNCQARNSGMKNNVLTGRQYYISAHYIYNSRQFWIVLLCLHFFSQFSSNFLKLSTPWKRSQSGWTPIRPIIYLIGYCTLRLLLPLEQQEVVIDLLFDGIVHLWNSFVIRTVHSCLNILDGFSFFPQELLIVLLICHSTAAKNC